MPFWIGGETIMNFLRSVSLAALSTLPFVVLGGACSVSAGGDLALGDACSSDLECASGDFCDQGTGVCTANGSIALGFACNDDRDCLAWRRLRPRERPVRDPRSTREHSVVGAACVDDAECDAGDFCADTGVCVVDGFSAGSESSGQPCYDDLDCSDSYCDVHTDTCV